MQIYAKKVHIYVQLQQITQNHTKSHKITQHYANLCAKCSYLCKITQNNTKLFKFMHKMHIFM